MKKTIILLFSITCATCHAQLSQKTINAAAQELRAGSMPHSNVEIDPNKWEGQRIPSREERLRMSRKERLALLESLGHLPDDRDWSDFEIGEETSWWGREPSLPFQQSHSSHSVIIPGPKSRVRGHTNIPAKQACLTCSSLSS